MKYNLRCDKHPEDDVYDRFVFSDASSEPLRVVLFGLLSKPSLMLSINSLHVLLVAAAHLTFGYLLVVGNWHLDIRAACIMMNQDLMSVTLLMRLRMGMMMRLHCASNHDILTRLDG